MACNDSKKVKKSLLWTAAIVALASIIYTCVTLLIYSENPNLTITEIMPFFVNNYCPTGLKGLLGAGLFAMSISTVESILNSNSVIFTNDILPFFNKMFSKKTYVPSVFIARTATIFFCCLGVFISLQFKDLFSILLAFSNFYYPVAMIPYVILTLGLNFKKSSIMNGIFSGILVAVVNYILTKNVNSYSIGLIAHLVGLFLTELYLRMKNKNQDTSAVEKTI